MHPIFVLLTLSLPKRSLMNSLSVHFQSMSYPSVQFLLLGLSMNYLFTQLQSLKCLPIQLQLIQLVLSCQSNPSQPMNLFVNYLPVQFPSMNLSLNCLSCQVLLMNCLSVQLQSVDSIMNSLFIWLWSLNCLPIQYQSLHPIVNYLLF